MNPLQQALVLNKNISVELQGFNPENNNVFTKQNSQISKLREGQRSIIHEITKFNNEIRMWQIDSMNIIQLNSILEDIQNNIRDITLEQREIQKIIQKADTNKKHKVQLLPTPSNILPASEIKKEGTDPGIEKGFGEISLELLRNKKENDLKSIPVLMPIMSDPLDPKGSDWPPKEFFSEEKSKIPSKKMKTVGEDNREKQIFTHLDNNIKPGRSEAISMLGAAAGVGLVSSNKNKGMLGTETRDKKLLRGLPENEREMVRPKTGEQTFHRESKKTNHKVGAISMLGAAAGVGLVSSNIFGGVPHQDGIETPVIEIPAFQDGGGVEKTGLVTAHKDEVAIPEKHGTGISQQDNIYSETQQATRNEMSYGKLHHRGNNFSTLWPGSTLSLLGNAIPNKTNNALIEEQAMPPRGPKHSKTIGNNNISENKIIGQGAISILGLGAASLFSTGIELKDENKILPGAIFQMPRGIEVTSDGPIPEMKPSEKLASMRGLGQVADDDGNPARENSTNRILDKGSTQSPELPKVNAKVENEKNHHVGQVPEPTTKQNWTSHNLDKQDDAQTRRDIEKIGEDEGRNEIFSKQIEAEGKKKIINLSAPKVLEGATHPILSNMPLLYMAAKSHHFKQRKLKYELDKSKNKQKWNEWRVENGKTKDSQNVLSSLEATSILMNTFALEKISEKPLLLEETVRTYDLDPRGKENISVYSDPKMPEYRRGSEGMFPETDTFGIEKMREEGTPVFGWINGLMGRVNGKNMHNLSSVQLHMPYLKRKMVNGNIVNALYQFDTKTSKKHTEARILSEPGANAKYTSGPNLPPKIERPEIENRTYSPIKLHDGPISRRLPKMELDGFRAVEMPRAEIIDRVAGIEKVKPLADNQQEKGDTVEHLPVYREDIARKPSNVTLGGSIKKLREIKKKELENRWERKRKVTERIDVPESTHGENELNRKEIYIALKEMLKKDAKRNGLVFR